MQLGSHGVSEVLVVVLPKIRRGLNVRKSLFSATLFGHLQGEKAAMPQNNFTANSGRGSSGFGVSRTTSGAEAAPH